MILRQNPILAAYEALLMLLEGGQQQQRFLVEHVRQSRIARLHVSPSMIHIGAYTSSSCRIASSIWASLALA